MKKETAAKAKRVIAGLVMSAAMGLPIAAQERGGYISSTGRSGYLVSTGRTDTPPTDEATMDIQSGNGTLGSGNRTNSVEDDNIINTVLDWISDVL